MSVLWTPLQIKCDQPFFFNTVTEALWNIVYNSSWRQNEYLYQLSWQSIQVVEVFHFWLKRQSYGCGHSNLNSMQKKSSWFHTRQILISVSSDSCRICKNGVKEKEILFFVYIIWLHPGGEPQSTKWNQLTIPAILTQLSLLTVTSILTYVIWNLFLCTYSNLAETIIFSWT